MPCFKGLAVSIHTPNGPLPEYSIQKQSRQNRISSYIPVPAPKFTPGSDRPEQSTFAISITLLNPGSPVPYSRPQPTPEDPQPSHKIVGGLPGLQSQRGKFTSVIGPYLPLTSSPNETVAAYIHFDGRPKEEVATLLRRGVETWVNSRWVGVPASEGGGLAEREFLFREVGLERWLNGLDLQGESKDVAARIERRKQKLEKKRRKRLQTKGSEDEEDEDDDISGTTPTRRARPLERNGVLRYGDNKSSPVEDVSGDDETVSSEDDSEDEMPEPEATGQIKVSLFRVMASGEIKKGEYSPAFDAHDDDDEGMHEAQGDDPGVDHTTTFAKPKTLDPKSISTQTVTGIDDPNRPYATFTFFYRSERQLQKMNIMPTPEGADNKKTETSKRKSRQMDFSSLGPLKSKEGTVGFAGYRDSNSKATAGKLKNGQGKRNEDDMDSDGDEASFTPVIKKESIDDADHKSHDHANGDADADDDIELSPEEVANRAELADGVKKMQLKRQHSFDPSQGKNVPSSINTTSTTTTTEPATSPRSGALSPPIPAQSRLSESALSAASPFKKQRASVTDMDGKQLFSSQLSPNSTHFTGGVSPDVVFSASQDRSSTSPTGAGLFASSDSAGEAAHSATKVEVKEEVGGTDKDGDEDL